MIKRKYFVILFLIIVFGTISQVSATNLNSSDDVIGDDASDIMVANATGEIISYDNEDFEDYVTVADDTPGTFADLADLISGGGSHTLKRDYFYNEDTDDDYTLGIEIEDDLNLYGDGYAIDGYGSEGIFIIRGNSEVHIHDLIFTNTDHTNMGGAIYNEGVLALYDCSFQNFIVTFEGGAIYNSESAKLEVSGCEFINCTASSEEDAAGGAIASYGLLYVIDSYFTNCTSDFGGAIAALSESYISNSNFGIYDESGLYVYGKNYATDTGGAIYSPLDQICDVVGCDFSNNEAEGAGGAVFGAHVCDSYFADDNCADNGGHNVACGVVMNCTQEDDNKDNYYDTMISEGFIYESDTLFFPKGSKSKTFDVTVTSNPTDEAVSLVVVAILVDDEDEPQYAITDNAGIASFELPYLSDGTHSVEVKLYTDCFSGISSINYDITVGKVDSEIKFDTSRLVFQLWKFR